MPESSIAKIESDSSQDIQNIVAVQLKKDKRKRERERERERERKGVVGSRLPC